MSDDELIVQYVEQHPIKSGRQEARLIDSKVSIWALVAYLHAVDGDMARVARDYDISDEAVRAALAYYRKHQSLFDAHLLLYEEAFR